jgi:transposase
MHYIGLDVHSKVTAICILDENGNKKERMLDGSLRTLVAAMQKVKKELGGPVKVCFEASGGSGWLFDQFTAMGFKVQVAHPGKLRLIFRSRHKNDRVDAAKLALLLKLDEVPLAHMPPAEIRQWRALIEFRSRLVGQRAACKNRIRALLRSVAINPPRGLWSKKGLTWLAAQEELSSLQRVQREMLVHELADVAKRIGLVEKELKTFADKMPSVALLMSMPGVGIRTAEAVVAYIDNADRFRRNKSVGCYFGLTPSEDTSVKIRLGHITKDGPGLVRRLVTEAAWQATRRDATVRAFFERVMRGEANRKKIALVATAHHLLRVMHAILRTGQPWRTTTTDADVAAA